MAKFPQVPKYIEESYQLGPLNFLDYDLILDNLPKFKSLNSLLKTDINDDLKSIILDNVPKYLTVKIDCYYDRLKVDYEWLDNIKYHLDDNLVDKTLIYDYSERIINTLSKRENSDFLSHSYTDYNRKNETIYKANVLISSQDNIRNNKGSQRRTSIHNILLYVMGVNTVPF